MTVYRDYAGMTPVGMKFSTLAGTVGGGVQTPGFIGHSKQYIGSHKFISAEGGIKRIVWMDKELKEEMEPVLRRVVGYIEILAQRGLVILGRDPDQGR